MRRSLRAVLTMSHDERGAAGDPEIVKRLARVVSKVALDGVSFVPRSTPVAALAAASTDESLDVVITDGHGTPRKGCDPVYGGSAQVQVPFSVCNLRQADGSGIRIPVWVLGCCRGGTEPYLDVVRRSLDREQLAFLACDRTASYGNATTVFPRVLNALADLGARVQDPAEAFAALCRVRYPAGWKPRLLDAA